MWCLFRRQRWALILRRILTGVISRQVKSMKRSSSHSFLISCWLSGCSGMFWFRKAEPVHWILWTGTLWIVIIYWRPAVDSLSRSFYTFPLMLTGSCPKRLDASVKTNFVRLIYDYCSGPQPADVQDLLILTILLRVESIIIKNHRVIQMNLISHHHSLKKTAGFHLNPYFIFQLQEL